jgi:hypothetical protein
MLWGKIKQVEITARVDAQGNVHDLTIPAAFFEAVRFLGASGELASEEAWHMTLTQSFLVLPGESVTRGNVWNYRIVSDRKTAVWRVDRLCTYEGSTDAGGQKERVAIQPTLAIEFLKGASASTEKKAKATGEGTAWFDSRTGRLLEMSLTQNQDLALDLEGREVRWQYAETLNVRLQEAK